ncbi:MAG: SEC-C metal-binding domain-containing protein [Bradymonadaceae bacterium]
MDDSPSKAEQMAALAAMGVVEPDDRPRKRVPRRAKTPYEADEEPGRNDPCKCGSGRKYKKCCLRKQKARR